MNHHACLRARHVAAMPAADAVAPAARVRRWLGWFVAALGIFRCCAYAGAAELNVCAAASLSDALQAIARVYEAHSGDTLRFNLAGSSLLERQIEEGAPADVFISADEAKMDRLARAGRIDAATRRTLLSNTLVIVVPAQDGPTVASAADLARPGIRRIALAEPTTVPAGIYARTYLTRLGLWARLQDKVVPTENVRACLAAVASGNVDAGIVYRTDAAISPEVRVAYTIDDPAAPAIAYPVACIAGSPHRAAAVAFVRFLEGPDARAIFVRFGFKPLAPAATMTTP